MGFSIEYSWYTITNIKHEWRLSLQLMTNWSLTCNYSNACLHLSSGVVGIFLLWERWQGIMVTYTIITGGGGGGGVPEWMVIFQG